MKEWVILHMEDLRSTKYESRKISSFTDLRVWKSGHRFVVDIYGVTKSFSKEEMFGLTSQIRRAAVSFTSNIAEGFSRFSKKEKIQFYFISLGSLTELQNQLLIARDIEYIDKGVFDKLAQDTVSLSKMINGLIKTSRS